MAIAKATSFLDTTTIAEFDEGVNCFTEIIDLGQQRQHLDATLKQQLQSRICKGSEHFKQVEYTLRSKEEDISNACEEEEVNFSIHQQANRDLEKKTAMLQITMDRIRQEQVQHELQEKEAIKEVQNAKSRIASAESQLSEVQKIKSSTENAAILSFFVPIIGTFVLTPLLLKKAYDLGNEAQSWQRSLEFRKEKLCEVSNDVQLAQNKRHSLEITRSSTVQEKRETQENIRRHENEIKNIKQQQLFLNSFLKKLRICLIYASRLSGRAECLKNLTRSIRTLKQVTDPLKLLRDQMKISDDEDSVLDVFKTDILCDAFCGKLDILAIDDSSDEDSSEDDSYLY